MTAKKKHSVQAAHNTKDKNLLLMSEIKNFLQPKIIFLRAVLASSGFMTARLFGLKILLRRPSTITKILLSIWILMRKEKLKKGVRKKFRTPIICKKIYFTSRNAPILLR